MTSVAGPELDGTNPQDFVGFAQFYAVGFPLVVGRVFLVVGHWFVAEDLTQDAMVEMMRQWEERSERSEADNIAWTIGIAMNLARRHRRRVAVGARALARWVGWQQSTLAQLENDVLAKADTYRWISALPQQQRAVAILWALADQSADEIARTLGISASTVRTHLQRIRRHFAHGSQTGLGGAGEMARSTGDRKT
jgi:RNA polymerase sigma factor (sigma-70 family)